MDAIRYEKDMYEPLRDHLIRQGFTVFAEARTCDLAAKRDDTVVVVEMKRHLSFDLLEQAVERQSFADAVYVAIPKPSGFSRSKSFRSKERVLARLGLGLLLVSVIGGKSFVEEALSPAEDNVARKNKRKRSALVRELDGRSMDLNIGGSRGVPLVTAYREASLFLAFLIDRHGPSTPKQLRALGADPKKTGPSLRSNFYQWFIRNEDATYQLSNLGEEALRQYAPLVGVFRERCMEPNEE